MFNIKTALVALATTLCVTLTFSESTEDSKKERLKSKVRHHLRNHTLTQTNNRAKDTLWNCTNGWNYFEVLTVQYPSEVILEICGELLLETIMEGPSQYTDIATFFGDGWHKTLSDKKLKNTTIENVTFSTEGALTSGDTTIVDSVHYGDTLITMTYYDWPDTCKGHSTFYPDGRMKEIVFFDGPEAKIELLCTYDNERLSEFIYRETDYDAGAIGEIYQERYPIEYNANAKVQKVVCIDEVLDNDLQPISSERDDSTMYTYDEKGNLTELISDGYWYERTLCEYDENNRIKKSVTFSWDTIANAWAHDYSDDSTIFTYDNSGNIVSIEEFEYGNDQFSLAYTYDYEFDAKGNLTGELYYDHDGGIKTLFDSTIYIYNEQNNLTTMTFYEAPTSIPEITAVTYSNGLPSEIVETFGDSLNLYELTWETITPIVHSNVQSKSIKPQVHRMGDRLVISGMAISDAQLFTVQGKAIQTDTHITSGKFSQLNLDGLARGTYLLKIQSTQGVMTTKIQL